MSDDVMFECDFSVDELAVLADLLEIPALPGVDPDMEVPDDAKGAAARGLVARGVVVADAARGTVEITQPYATMIATVLFATVARAGESGLAFVRDDLVVRARPAHTITRWQLARHDASVPAFAEARQDGDTVVSGPAAHD
jgi:hypothetical protein